jgi:hypothetical protein
MRGTCRYGGDHFSTPWGRFVPDRSQIAQRVPAILTDKSSYISARTIAKLPEQPTEPPALPNDAPYPHNGTRGYYIHHSVCQTRKHSMFIALLHVSQPYFTLVRPLHWTQRKPFSRVSGA